MNNLARWIRTQSPTTPSLAYCHTKNMWQFQSIVESGFLSPQECKVFNEDISYFFYGRPAYRRAVDPVITSAKAPVVIIFNPVSITIPKRIFPFDSGAFPDRYKTWLATGMKRENFELDADMVSPLRHVSAFFQNNLNYWECTTCIQPKATGAELEAETLCKIYNDTSPPGGADDRKHAVELQIDHPIPLDDKAILAIILPRQCLDYEFVKSFKATTGFGIDFIGYDLNHHKSAAEYQSSLEDRAKELHTRLKLL